MQCRAECNGAAQLMGALYEQPLPDSGAENDPLDASWRGQPQRRSMESGRLGNRYPEQQGLAASTRGSWEHGLWQWHPLAGGARQ